MFFIFHTLVHLVSSRFCETHPHTHAVPYLIGAPRAAAYTTGIGYKTYQNASFPLRSLLPSRAATLDYTAAMAYIANRPMAMRTVYAVPYACLNPNVNAAPLAPVAVPGEGAGSAARAVAFGACLNPISVPVNQFTYFRYIAVDQMEGNL